MKPLELPDMPKEARYRFVLIDLKDLAAYGPFPSVIAADMWGEAAGINYRNTRVVLMEAPDERPA